jgi:magnesium transporter
MIVDNAVYQDGERRAEPLALDDTYQMCDEEFESVRREFELHELAVEDAIHAHQRPKLEIYGDSLFLVLKTARYRDDEETVEFGEINLFVGDGFVVSVRHGEPSALGDVRKGVEERPDLLRCGPGAVLHAIVDRVVDDYMPVLEGLEYDIEQVETQVFSSSRENPAERIYKLKREILEFHRFTAPLITPLDRLARGQFELIAEPLREYYRDVYDHLVRVVGALDDHRELLTGVLEANLTQVSVRQNEDVRKISAWVAIVAVPTMMAGIYGMNFEYMPELTWTFGYPLVVGLMVVVCLVLWWRFRRSGWL